MNLLVALPHELREEFLNFSWFSAVLSILLIFDLVFVQLL
jgi:hypothetical protein